MRKLGVVEKHRRSLLANQVKTIISSGFINTTITRAKETKRMMEKMITLAKHGDLASRRKALAFLHNDKELVSKLFSEIGPKYTNRNGGYTRILVLGERRGDNSLMVRLELVEE